MLTKYINEVSKNVIIKCWETESLPLELADNWHTCWLQISNLAAPNTATLSQKSLDNMTSTLSTNTQLYENMYISTVQRNSSKEI